MGVISVGYGMVSRVLLMAAWLTYLMPCC